MRVPGFTKHWAEFVAGYLRTEEEFAVIRELLDLKPSFNILDLGCGPGRFAPLFEQSGCTYVGIDTNGAQLEVAPRSDATDYIEGECSEVLKDIESATQDGALSWFASLGFHGQEKDQALFHEVHRVLRPGARLAISVLNADKPHVLDRVLCRAADGTVLAEFGSYDTTEHTVKVEFYEITPDLHTTYEVGTQQFYTSMELRSMLVKEGFSVHFHEVEADSPYIILYGEK